MGSRKQYLETVVEAQKSGEATGIYSVCSANRYVIDAAILQGIEDSSHVLIEATCNQVNQFGGYTGMKPEGYTGYVRSRAAALGLPADRLILGGDHLGPYPFREEKTEGALGKTLAMVRAFVAAGCTKIHLDTSYRISGDPGDPGSPPPPPLIGERCALLCAESEKTYHEMAAAGHEGPPPLYVIGTEVPAPGGSETSVPEDRITTAKDLEETIAITRESFARRDLEDAWERVIAVVVEPGVEHGDQSILEYDRRRTTHLTEVIGRYRSLVFEAHTTDYQTASALRRMVEDGFAILKTGQSQTFAAREAVFMLAHIERELPEGRKNVSPSSFVEVLDRAMVDNPLYWRGHYAGRSAEFQRKYSFFDRQRYYWTVPEVERALNRLIATLRESSIPLSLLSQYLPEQYKKVRMGLLANDPEQLILDRIMDHMREYSFAVALREDIVDWWKRGG